MNEFPRCRTPTPLLVTLSRNGYGPDWWLIRKMSIHQKSELIDVFSVVFGIVYQIYFHQSRFCARFPSLPVYQAKATGRVFDDVYVVFVVSR